MPRGSWKRLTKVQVANIVAAYLNGTSLKELARRHECSPGRLSKMLDRMGVAKRAPTPMYRVTKDHIQRESAKIRSTWDEAEHRRRASETTDPLTVPCIEGNKHRAGSTMQE